MRNSGEPVNPVLDLVPLGSKQAFLKLMQVTGGPGPFVVVHLPRLPLQMESLPTVAKEFLLKASPTTLPTLTE